MRKILVLRGGALGDFIVTLPALATLREAFPAAQIELAGNATAAAVAQNRGLLDVVHSQHEARWSALHGEAPLPPEFASWLSTFDLVLSFWPDPDGELARHFPLRTGQRFLSAPALPTCAPAAAHYCAALRPLGLEGSSHLFSLTPQSRADLRRVPSITLHPGSGSPRKNWPGENWRELIAKLPRPLSLILGEAESETWRTFSARDVTLLVEPPLETLVAHLSQTRLFLGHDSGISHLAAACGAPCVLLFGPTDPKLWAPPAAHVRVIQRGADLRVISVADVQTAIAETLGPS